MRDNLGGEMAHAAAREGYETVVVKMGPPPLGYDPLPQPVLRPNRDDEAAMAKTMRRVLAFCLLVLGGMLYAAWRVAQS